MVMFCHGADLKTGEASTRADFSMNNVQLIGTMNALMEVGET